jgi:N utilization substance protein B
VTPPAPAPAPERGRRASRRSAVFLLYQHEVTGIPIEELVENARREGTGPDQFALDLVRGVSADRPAIDAEIAAAAKGWTLDRIAPLERSILRVATFEIRSSPDVAPAVAINEAVELAKRYCQADAGAFVNGVLGAVAAAHEAAG